MNLHRPLAALLLPLLLAACGDQGATSAPAAPHRLTVCTTFYPTTYFATRICGAHATVVCPLPADADAAFWQPTAVQISQYQQADLIVLNGANFEHWPQTATLPESKVIASADAFKKDWIEVKNAITHSHGPAGAHTHTGVNGHTWPDPINAIAQANAIRDGMIAHDPEHKAEYAANAKALENDLLGLDAQFKALPIAEPLFASHPSYVYLARRYGWNLTSFGLEADEPPTEAQLAEITKAKADHPGVKLMLWESAPCQEARQAMDTLGLDTVIFNPAEQPDLEGDYLDIMRENLRRLRAAMEPTDR